MKNTILNFMRPCSREDAERLHQKIVDQVIQESKAEQSKKKEILAKKRLQELAEHQLEYSRKKIVVNQQNIIYGGTNSINFHTNPINNNNKIDSDSESNHYHVSDEAMEEMQDEIQEILQETAAPFTVTSSNSNENHYNNNINLKQTVTATPGTFNRPPNYTDWVGNYSMFAMIKSAVERERSWTKAVQALRAPVYSGQFDKLNESSLRLWFQQGTFKLKPKVQARWEAGNNRLFHSLDSGRQYFLANYPEIDKSLKDCLNAMRKTGSVVNSLIASSLMTGVLASSGISELARIAPTRRYCRYWMRKHLNWTYRKATTSGQKLPLKWEEQFKLMQHRLAAVVATHQVKHSSLIINWDQTAVLLMPTFHYTYHNKSERQVPVIALEEKRQVTAVVASALNGELLPLQLIFGGQDKNKKQTKSVPVLTREIAEEIKSTGFHLTQTHNHWSTLESMKDYIRTIIVPWVNLKKIQHSCLDSHVLLIFDCWSVHKSKEFLIWLAEHYPTFHVVFVPAGCTGKAQPADVLLQRPFKHEISNCYSKWITACVTEMRKSGSNVEDIRIDTSIKKLKPLLVEWTLNSWKLLNSKTKFVKQGWENMGFAKTFNSEFQIESMRMVAAKQLEIDANNDSNGIEAEPISYADINAINEETEDFDEHEDEDETKQEEKSDVLLVQLCTQASNISKDSIDSATNNLRRSPRIQAVNQQYLDQRISSVMQDQIYTSI